MEQNPHMIRVEESEEELEISVSELVNIHSADSEDEVDWYE